MNLWLIVGIIAGLLVFGGIVFVSATSENPEPDAAASCTSCGNKCTAESNCGLATCGVANGGTCGCGK